MATLADVADQIRESFERAAIWARIMHDDNEDQGSTDWEEADKQRGIAEGLADAFVIVWQANGGSSTEADQIIEGIATTICNIDPATLETIRETL